MSKPFKPGESVRVRLFGDFRLTHVVNVTACGAGRWTVVAAHPDTPRRKDTHLSYIVGSRHGDDNVQPVRMSRADYAEAKQMLDAQYEAARKVVTLYATLHENFPEPGPLTDEFTDAWNAAHDAVTALDQRRYQLDVEWLTRDVDRNTLELVAANVD